MQKHKWKTTEGSDPPGIEALGAEVRNRIAAAGGNTSRVATELDLPSHTLLAIAAGARVRKGSLAALRERLAALGSQRSVA